MYKFLITILLLLPGTVMADWSHTFSGDLNPDDNLVTLTFNCASCEIGDGGVVVELLMRELDTGVYFSGDTNPGISYMGLFPPSGHGDAIFTVPVTGSGPEYTAVFHARAAAAYTPLFTDVRYKFTAADGTKSSWFDDTVTNNPPAGAPFELIFNETSTNCTSNCLVIFNATAGNGALKLEAHNGVGWAALTDFNTGTEWSAVANPPNFANMGFGSACSVSWAYDYPICEFRWYYIPDGGVEEGPYDGPTVDLSKCQVQ